MATGTYARSPAGSPGEVRRAGAMPRPGATPETGPGAGTGANAGANTGADTPTSSQARPAPLAKAAPARRLKLAMIVTEFPKTTETFIMRDVMDLSALDCDVRIFHLTHFNQRDTVHDFARPTLGWATDYPYLMSTEVLASLWRGLRGRDGRLRRIVKDILRGCRHDPSMLLKSFFILPKSLRIADELRRWGADHVHAAYAGHPTTAAWIAHRMTGIPFSLSSHAHDLFETQALLAEKLPEAAFVRTISDYNKAFILRHVPALAAHPPEVIHVGTYPGAAPLPAPRGRAPFRLLYVGSLEERKGVDLLLRAMSRLALKDWQLDILGDGPERKRLEKLATTLPIRRHVTFHGRQRNETVQEAMRAASVLVVPSRIGARNQTEGLPTVIVEAFSHGLPVVATRLTGIPEIVRDGETGLLFEMNDIPGLMRAISSIHADPQGATRMAQAGRRLVEAEFDQCRNAERLLGLIRQSVRPAPDARSIE
ncbi:glycosyltransferase family 4 protein [Acidimangrovimonas sediminis]|uniref:glycosyltransferase family 4 protein n=1 Tax=Acidimangrovimonas sediminis TaxID=2056283 RepID=UPI000C7F8BC4|nr:glycosyltransferase family 4 protein [Acidimangrovimonas sediminis]